MNFSAIFYFQQLRSPAEQEPASDDNDMHTAASASEHVAAHDRGPGWQHVGFFLLVPAMFASYAASSHRLHTVLDAWQVLAYCLAHALVAWWVVCAVTRGVQELLRRWRPHQLIVLTLGVLLTQWLYAPVTGLLDQGFLALLNPSAPVREVEAAMHPHSASPAWMPTAFRDYLIWIVVNLVFDRFLGLPRYRYEAAGEPAPQAEVSQRRQALPASSETGINPPGENPAPSVSADAGFAFLERIDNPPHADDVIALKAEQHYLKVITRDKSYITLYRFGDAVNALPESIGIQVHRSWWIRRDALVCLHQRGRKMLAELEGGGRVPVSGPNQALMRRIAAENDAGIKPLAKEYSPA